MSKTISELWEDIFKDFDVINKIEQNGLFIITADEIREYKEPRLMAKFDFSKQVPRIFKENGIGILPIKNGEYILGKFRLFQKLPQSLDNIDIKKVELPDFIETIDPDNIYSENNALNVANLSGMFSDAIGENVVETIQGKMRTHSFEFNISGNKIDVNGAAIEVDGGYEGEKNILLVEAKNQMPEDFIIRQLYYPYRYWNDKVMKNITPMFFTYDNGIYTLFIYRFTDKENYNSLELQDIKRYMLESRDSKTLKRKIFENVAIVNELPQSIIPFPQADSFSRIINILEIIDGGINTANKISEEFEFEPRQGSYYISAAKYLGLIDKDDSNGSYKLTPTGFALNNIDSKSRNQHLISLILSHKPFYLAYEYYLKNDSIPSKDEIVRFISENTDITNESVLIRRSSTIRGWIEWIIGCQI